MSTKLKNYELISGCGLMLVILVFLCFGIYSGYNYFFGEDKIELTKFKIIEKKASANSLIRYQRDTNNLYNFKDYSGSFDIISIDLDDSSKADQLRPKKVLTLRDKNSSFYIDKFRPDGIDILMKSSFNWNPLYLRASLAPPF